MLLDADVGREGKRYFHISIGPSKTYITLCILELNMSVVVVPSVAISPYHSVDRTIDRRKMGQVHRIANSQETK